MLSDVIELLDQDELDFGKLIELTWTVLLEVFQHVLVELLGELDQHLMGQRDVSRYVLKDRKRRTVQTLVGDVTFTRRYYWDRAKQCWCFLLDEALGLESRDRVGPGLLKLAVTWATKGPSLRDARDRLRDLYTFQVLSHETIRQATLQTGAVIERATANEVVTRVGDREVAALFVEADGFYVAMQGSRSSQEAKLVVVHEGWEQRQGRGQAADYRLVNSQYLTFLEPREDLWEQVRGYLASRYANLDAIPVVINGDGAAWIQRGAASFRQGFYQYDRYHLSRLVREALRERPEQLRAAQEALQRDDLGSLGVIVTEAEQATSDPETEAHLAALRQLLAERHAVLRDYRLQLQEAGFEVPANWRSMGAAESNVDRFKNRTAKRGRAWSPEGARAMLRALGKLFEGCLADFVQRSVEPLEEWVLDRVEAGAGYIARAITRPSVAVRAGRFPAADRGTQGYGPLFRQIVHFQSP